MSRQHKAINNLYELTSTWQVIRYYLAAAWLLMKATWLKAFWAGFYATWLMLTTTAVTKYFPKLDETQKGQRWQQRQGVQSTKENNDINNMHIPHMPQTRSREISINIDDMKLIMYSDQTGKFLVVSSQGNSCQTDEKQRICAKHMKDSCNGCKTVE